MKNTLRFVCLATIRRCLLYGGLLVFIQPAFAQSHIVELFVSVKCGPQEVAERIVRDLNQKNSTNGVLALICDLYNESCDERHSYYINKDVLYQSSTPSSVVNGRYDVLADNERVMHSALAMVRSTMSLHSIDLRVEEDMLIATLPDMGDDALYTLWVAVYNPETAHVSSFIKLDSVRGNAPVCLQIPNVVEEGQAYAIFLHQAGTGELVASGSSLL